MHPLYLKFQKACRRLQRLLSSGKAASSQQIAVLAKRCERYAKQLSQSPSMAAKWGGALCLASAFSFTSQAQNCGTFVPGDSSNPIRRTGLPTNLWQPTFVDVDGDGDLDCYQTSPDRGKGGPADVQVTFLRNTGSARFPYFEVDTASGLPKNLGTKAPYNSNVTRLSFVDIDGDGDYDCFAGDYYYSIGDHGRMKYFKNVGTAKKPKFISAESENPVGNLNGAYIFQFSFADFDSDGDYDLLITDYYGTKFYPNNGTATAPDFGFGKDEYFYFALQSTYDYNKDGRPDLFNGRSSNIDYYRNVGNTGQLRFIKDTVTGPKKMPNQFQTFSFADLNKDGVAEAFSIDGRYAVSTVAPTIRAISNTGSSVTLRARPVNTAYAYQWYKDGKKIAGAVNSDYTATTAGRYSAEIKNDCGTGTSLPYLFTGNALADKTAVTLADAIHSSSLVAYPNPFTEHFTLQVENAAVNTVIKITDVQGKVISTVKANRSVMQLGSNLQKGVYIVQVIQNNTTVLTQKIIKQ